RPTVKDRDVLIRVHATTVCAADWRLRKAEPALVRLMNGLTKPGKTKILGMEFSGVVEATGNAVTRFRSGDAVFGASGFRCGTHAEYVCVPAEGMIAPRPANMTFDEAAAVLFGGITALHFLRKAKIQPGHRVLVNGASGSVGVFAVQLAKHFEGHVTGVCSAANVDLVRSLGADHVIDYTREDFTNAGPIYDVILDAVGVSMLSRGLKPLKRGGSYLLVGASAGMLWIIGTMLRALWTTATGRARTITGVPDNKVEDQVFLKTLIEAGKLRTVIDRRYPLEQIVEAHRLAESHRKKGHVVVTCI